MNPRKLALNATLSLIAALIAVLVVGYIYLDWRGRQNALAKEAGKSDASAPVAMANMPARISKEARQNLKLVSKPATVTNYSRRIEVPAVVTDRPGVSDRGVVAPVTGVISKIHAYPGNIVAPNSPLFSLRLVSDTLHTSQLELFKASKEIEIARQHRRRLQDVADKGGVALTRIIEIDNQIQRMEVNVQAYRQDLLARGLPTDRIDAAATGAFVTEITINAPGEQALTNPEIALTSANDEPALLPFSFELQYLKVELGQHVEAGTLLCNLADHRALLIEGKGFKKDIALIQNAAKDHLPIEVKFEGSDGNDWPPFPEKLYIEHVANLIDPTNRTFSFFLPLVNDWKVYQRDGKERLLWRFRPGDRFRLSLEVETMENVFVLPQAALVREGPEAYVFRQNGDLFDRIGVHVLHEDSTSVVIANDGKLKKNAAIAQNSAASINRVLKAQLASGQPTNLHVHADGTTHAAH